MSQDPGPTVEALKNGKNIVVLTHVNMDGDALGSAMGMTIALKSMGKNTVFYTEDSVPHYLRYMPKLDWIQDNWMQVMTNLDTILICDCGDLYRVGPVEKRIIDHLNILNVDHHASNPLFGRVNLVDETASSTSEICYRVLTQMGYEFDEDVATCLYTGIYSDTSAFQNTNSTPESFQICGELVQAGANPAMIARYLYRQQSPGRARLFRLVVPTLEIEPNGRIAGMIVTTEMFRDASADSSSLEGFVEFPLSIEGVDASYVLRELPHANGRPNRVKGSVRTTEAIDATEVCGHFGGGGHRRASGFTADGDIETIRKELIEQFHRHLQ